MNHHDLNGITYAYKLSRTRVIKLFTIMRAKFLLILILPLMYGVLYTIRELLKKYSFLKVFVGWTVISVLIWAVCYTVHMRFYSPYTDYTASLNIWQYIIMVDLAIYIFFLMLSMILLIKARKN